MWQGGRNVPCPPGLDPPAWICPPPGLIDLDQITAVGFALMKEDLYLHDLWKTRRTRKNRRYYRQGTSHCSCLEHCFLFQHCFSAVLITLCPAGRWIQWTRACSITQDVLFSVALYKSIGVVCAKRRFRAVAPVDMCRVVVFEASSACEELADDSPRFVDQTQSSVVFTYIFSLF